MKKLFLFYLIIFGSNCFAQNNNPQPPFSNIYRRPNINPYTFINPENNAMDYQQMFYLQDKQENLINEYNQKSIFKEQSKRYYISPNGYNNKIRPTGHKSYFMNLP